MAFTSKTLFVLFALTLFGTGGCRRDAEEPGSHRTTGDEIEDEAEETSEDVEEDIDEATEDLDDNNE